MTNINKSQADNAHVKTIRVSGVACPECQNFIPMSIQGLLTSNCFSCPSCGLTLNLNIAASEVAIKALSKLYNGQKNFDPNPKFNL